MHATETQANVDPTVQPEEQPTGKYTRRWKVFRWRAEGGAEGGAITSGSYPPWRAEEWKPGGDWHEIPAAYDIRLCEVGYHSSPTLLEASRFVEGSVIGEVEVDGDVDEEKEEEDGTPNKTAHRRMRLVRAWLLDSSFYQELAGRIEYRLLDEWLDTENSRLTAVEVTTAMTDIREATGLSHALRVVKHEFRHEVQKSIVHLLHWSTPSLLIGDSGAYEDVQSLVED